MKNVPNILSALRIILTPIFLYLYWEGSFIWGIVGLGVFSLASLTDFLDGYIARKYKIETELGTFLDPLADKILTFSAFISLLFLNDRLFPWWAIAIIVFRDIFITVMRIVAKMRKVKMKTLKMGKIKTAVQLVFLYVALFLGVIKGYPHWIGDFAKDILKTDIMLVLTISVMAFTAYSGLEYIIKNRNLFRTGYGSGF